MKSHLIISSLFVLCSHLALAQSPADSIKVRFDSLVQSKTSKLDTINSKIDSLQDRLNRLANPDLSLGNLTNRLSKRPSVPDSLKAAHDLDSMKSGLTHRIDSLKRLNLPTDRYTRQLDSLKGISPDKYIAGMQSKANSVQSKINQSGQQLEDKINKPLANAENKINDKLNVIRQEGGDKANLPGNLDTKVDLPGANLKQVNVGDKLNTDLKLPDANLNASNPLGNVSNPVGEQLGQVNELKEKTGDITNLPKEQLNKIKSNDAIEGVQSKLGNVNEVTDKVQGYQGEVKDVLKGDLTNTEKLSKEAEDKLKNLDEVKQLDQQTGELSKYKEMVGQGNNPEAVKEMAQQQVVTYAKDHFAGKEEVLKAAMDKMSKLKEKYPDMPSMQEMTRRVPNAMRGKPFIERIVPGMTFQVLKGSNLWIDGNATLSYRISGVWNAGLGWNERVSFHKWNQTVPIDRIYGPRAFTSVIIKRGFGVKIEAERMNAYLPATPINPDLGYRQWVWTAYVGLKKEYAISKNVKGNIQTLYSFYTDHNKSPYPDRFNVRMGFEVMLKKKKKN